MSPSDHQPGKPNGHRERDDGRKSSTSEMVVAGGLLCLLGDLLVLQYKLRHLYWRVRAEGFDDYLDALGAIRPRIDEQIETIGSRVAELGRSIPTVPAAQLRLSSVAPDTHEVPIDTTLVQLLRDHAQVALDVDTLALTLRAELSADDAQRLALLYECLEHGRRRLQALIDADLERTSP